MKSDVVIIGGGIIGLYSAYKLASSGINVTLLDKGAFGQESSWAAGGILTPLLPWDYDQNVLSLTDNANTDYSELADTLFSETGLDIQFWRCGLSVLDTSNHRAAKQWCSAHNVKYESSSHLHRSSFFLPNVAQIRTPRLIKAIVAWLSQKGVNLMPNTSVTRCQLINREIAGVETTRGIIPTKQLIWATGAWAPQLSSSGISIQLPEITPVQGQIIVMRGGNIELNQILYKDGHYLIPRKDGLILAGSTLENVGYNKAVTDVARQDLWEKSVSLLPELAESEVVHQWAGLRPGSTNNLPTIGAHPDIKGLYLNCGHFRYGIAMAPASAKIITECLLSPEDSSFDTDYSLSSEFN